MGLSLLLTAATCYHSGILSRTFMIRVKNRGSVIHNMITAQIVLLSVNHNDKNRSVCLKPFSRCMSISSVSHF